MPSIPADSLKRLRALAPMIPGEHLLEIKSAEVKRSKAGNVMIALMLEDKDEKKVWSYITLNRKATGYATEFWNAVGIGPKEIKAAGGVHILVGKKVWAFTGVEEHEGNKKTKIEGWICDQDTRTVGEQMELSNAKEYPTPARQDATPPPAVEQIF